jgi:hypothetical protein
LGHDRNDLDDEATRNEGAPNTRAATMLAASARLMRAPRAALARPVPLLGRRYRLGASRRRQLSLCESRELCDGQVALYLSTYLIRGLPTAHVGVGTGVIVRLAAQLSV